MRFLRPLTGVTRRDHVRNGTSTANWRRQMNCKVPSEVKGKCTMDASRSPYSERHWNVDTEGKETLEGLRNDRRIKSVVVSRVHKPCENNKEALCNYHNKISIYEQHYLLLKQETNIISWL
jgi:hypothetical protein